MADDIRQAMIELLPRLRRFAYSLTGDLDKADDLVQDTCVRALAKIEQWQAGSRLDSWMYRIAQNLWIDRVRSQKARGQSFDVELLENVSGSDGRDVTQGKLDLERVSREITRLPHDQQVLIGLVCVDGLGYREAAESLGIPIGTVMSRLSRARKALGQAFMPEASDTSPLPSGGRNADLR